MPAYNIRVDDGMGIVTVCHGDLHSDEFLSAVIDRYDKPDELAKLRYVLTDHLAVDSFNLSTEMISKSATSVLKHQKSILIFCWWVFQNPIWDMD